MAAPTEAVAGLESISMALVRYTPCSGMPAIIDLDLVPFSDVPSTSTSLVHIPKPSKLPPHTDKSYAPDPHQHSTGRNMSRSEYTAEMAVTVGFDPDAELLVMTPELEASLDNLLTACEGLRKSLEELSKAVKDMTETVRDMTDEMQDMNKRLDELETGREERIRKMEERYARKLKERRARKLKEKDTQELRDERPRKLRKVGASSLSC